MSSSVVAALIGFGETLEDSSVETKTKLHVLGTLNEVSLTLSELSESGVGRAVSKLKSSPGELGSTARLLVTKWKRLLREHLAKESVQLPQDLSEVEVTTDNHTSLSPQCQGSTLHASDKRATGKRHSKGRKHSSPVHPLSPNTDINSSVAECKPPGVSTSSPSIPTQSFRTNRSPSPPLNTPSKQAVKSGVKRKFSGSVESLDSSSGLSFMESLMVGSSSHPSSRKKSKKAQTKCNSSPSANGHVQSQFQSSSFKTPPKLPAAFTAEVLSSLSEDVDRPDIIRPSNSREIVDTDAAFEDGDLKFKSKKVLWVPKASRTNSSLHPNSSVGQLSDTPGEHFSDPSSLVDLCLDVLEHNLSRVDHVGHVPYDLLARVLRHASPEDLMRIEHFNPQFVGCTDELWQRHVQLTFRHRKEEVPHPNETWCSFYQRLSREETSRLNRIISQSARKIKEEQEARRTTLTTEVITPRQVQRRAGRHAGPSTTKPHTKPHQSSSPVVFRPYNVSKPSSDQPSLTSSLKKQPVVSSDLSAKGGSSSNTACNNGGGLLNKLRKQFRSGRLR
ncbi:Transcription elongation factor B polypeptide 3 [Clonorchis sinensis]|uniref:Elongin-A n=1 Tax=Clonorchis sinensis TaxID=79923 RepID=A0A419PEK8_CLOSI|nr:Transcription elongation factor B polypeptide 3 [Clonorchis sinensis]